VFGISGAPGTTLAGGRSSQRKMRSDFPQMQPAGARGFRQLPRRILTPDANLGRRRSRTPKRMAPRVAGPRLVRKSRDSTQKGGRKSTRAF
jgi:hypothetical protein